MSRPYQIPRSLIVSVSLMIIGVVLFVLIYTSVKNHSGIALLDAPLFKWMMTHQSQPLVAIMTVITDVLSPVGISILILIAATITFKKRQGHWAPFLLIGAEATGFILAALIKSATARPRPILPHSFQSGAISYSFPSGHTIGVAVCLLVVGYIAFRRAPNRKQLIISSLIALLGTLVMAFSRVYLGFHWLTDVLASSALALSIIGVVIAVDYSYARHSRNLT